MSKIKLRLAHKIGNIERLSAELISRAEKSGKPDFRPAPDQWSVAEVIEHLALIAEAVAKHSTVERSQHWQDSLRRRLARAVGWLALRNPIKFKSPQSVMPKNSPLVESVVRLRSANLQLRKSANDLPEENLVRLVWMNHPRLGELNFVQCIEFVENHLRHHVFQFARIESAYNREQSSARSM